MALFFLQKLVNQTLVYFTNNTRNFFYVIFGVTSLKSMVAALYQDCENNIPLSIVNSFRIFRIKYFT